MSVESGYKESVVDIILTNFNKSEFVAEAIKSVLDQTYKNWSLIIVDDCSQDNSKKIINTFKGNNINKIFLKKNKGVSFCRNLGIRLSKSMYISFLDSDDYWTENKLEEQISFMQKNNYRFTYTDYTPFIVKNNKKIFKKKIIAPVSFNYNEFIKNTSIGMSSMIIKRSIIETVKFRRLKICEDYFFKCQILKKGNIALKFEQNTMFYRISKNSLQSNKLRNLYWVWKINKNYNHLSLYNNLKSLLFIVINSIKKYGIK